MEAMSVDTVTSGNSATQIGPRNDCVQLAAGSQVAVDVTALNISESDPAIGFNYILNYDPRYISVTEADHELLLAARGGSSVSLIGTDSTPDGDGEYRAAILDLGPAPESSESGSGVISRLTLSIEPDTPPDLYQLALADAIHVTSEGGMPAPQVPKDVFDASLAVGRPCGEPVKGDINCNGAINGDDAFLLLRYIAGLEANTGAGCAAIGTPEEGETKGDMDCDEEIGMVDPLNTLRYAAGAEPVGIPPGCLAIGA